MRGPTGAWGAAPGWETMLDADVYDDHKDDADDVVVADARRLTMAAAPRHTNTHCCQIDGTLLPLRQNGFHFPHPLSINYSFPKLNQISKGQYFQLST